MSARLSLGLLIAAAILASIAPQIATAAADEKLAAGGSESGGPKRRLASRRRSTTSCSRIWGPTRFRATTPNNRPQKRGRTRKPIRWIESCSKA